MFGALNISARNFAAGNLKNVTDHKPLNWIMSLKEPNSKLVRWRLKLEEFDYDIEHRAGKRISMQTYYPVYQSTLTLTKAQILAKQPTVPNPII